jgi:hypothetical protein
LSWRNLFYEIANLISEYDGDEMIKNIDNSEDKKNENIKK